MKITRIPPLAILLLFLNFEGCVTKDIKVVDALSVGMNRTDANSKVESYGFKIDKSTKRPSDGWRESRDNLERIETRAKWVEENKNVVVQVVDLYHVGHGLLGWGLLFLFYDEDSVLIHYYRKQLN